MPFKIPVYAGPRGRWLYDRAQLFALTLPIERLPFGNI
jgi:hypothetical protein